MYAVAMLSRNVRYLALTSAKTSRQRQVMVKQALPKGMSIHPSEARSINNNKAAVGFGESGRQTPHGNAVGLPTFG